MNSFKTNKTFIANALDYSIILVYLFGNESNLLDYVETSKDHHVLYSVGKALFGVAPWAQSIQEGFVALLQSYNKMLHRQHFHLKHHHISQGQRLCSKCQISVNLINNKDAAEKSNSNNCALVAFEQNT